MSNEEARSKGTVKWFNAGKGYGFIVTDDGQELFAHFSAIETGDKDQYRTLEENQEVSFLITKGAKGLQAADIRVVRNAAAPAA